MCRWTCVLTICLTLYVYMYLIQLVHMTCLTPVCIFVSISLNACYLWNTFVCVHVSNSLHINNISVVPFCVSAHLSLNQYRFTHVHIVCMQQAKITIIIISDMSLHQNTLPVCVHVYNYNSLSTQYLCCTCITTCCCQQPEVFLNNLINTCTYRQNHACLLSRDVKITMS